MPPSMSRKSGRKENQFDWRIGRIASASNSTTISFAARGAQR